MDPHSDAFEKKPPLNEHNLPNKQIPIIGDANDAVDEDTYERIDIDENTGALDIATSQELTRAKIALLFTQSFLLLIVFALAVPFIMAIAKPVEFPDPIDNAKTLVTLLASVLAGPFGFIVGFYFKQNSKT